MKRQNALASIAALILATLISAHAQQSTPEIKSPVSQEIQSLPLERNSSPTVFSLEYHVSLSQFDQSNEIANSVAQLSNGNIVAAGGDGNLGNNCGTDGGAWLVAVTNAGAAAYQNLDTFCPSNAPANTIRPTQDGGAVILFSDGGSAACLICAGVAKLTSSGHISWQYELTSFFLSTIRGIQQLPSGEFVAVGQAADTSGVYGGFIMLLSQQGVLESFSPVFYEDANSFPGATTGSLTFNSVVPTADNGYFVSGTATANLQGTGFFNVPVALKFDQNFNLESPWPEVFYSSNWGSAAPGDSNYPVFQSADGNLVMAGAVQNPSSPFASRFALMKLDAGGKLLWQYGYGATSGSFDVNKAAAAIQNTDGTFVLAGISNAFLSSRFLAYGGWSIKVSSAGNAILWQNSYSGVPPASGAIKETYFNDVIATADGGYAMVGASYYGSATYGGPALLLDKTDGNGNIGSCSCVLPTHVSPQTLDLSVYPAAFTTVTSPPTFTPTGLTSKITNVKPTKIF